MPAGTRNPQVARSRHSVDRLRRENERLRRETEQLRREKDHLHRDTDRLQRERDRLQRERDGLRRQVGRLKEALVAARRAGFRQAALFAKDRRQGRGGRPGRRAGAHYGRHGCRRRPPGVDQTHTARASACPGCGGAVAFERVATQYQCTATRRGRSSGRGRDGLQ